MGNYKGKSISLERKQAVSLEDAIPQFLKSMRWSAEMNEHLVLSAWDKVTGAGAYTLSKYMKNGVLYCGISSSVVRNQLFFNKGAIIEAINKEVLSDPLFSSKDGKGPLKTLILR